MKIFILAILIAATQVLRADEKESMDPAPGIAVVSNPVPTATSRKKDERERMLEKTISVVYFSFAGATVAAGIVALYFHKRRNEDSRRH